jgi:hypothetical protein
LTKTTKFYLKTFNSKESKSARALAKHASIFKVGKNAKTPPERTLNWGYKQGDKIETLLMLEYNDISTVPYTKYHVKALQWLEEGNEVIARTMLNSSSGKGIVMLSEQPDLIAPLYTKYIKKKREFRAHFLNGDNFLISEKKLKAGAKPNRIRSHSNGYVFCTQDLEPFPDALGKVIGQLAQLHMPQAFFAADIIYNEFHDTAYVLELNTSPGLENSTLDIYKEQIDKWRDSYDMNPVQPVDPETTLESTPTGVHTASDVGFLNELNKAYSKYKTTHSIHNPFLYTAQETYQPALLNIIANDMD